MTDGAFAPVRRAALWIPGTGPAHDLERGHLFILLTDLGPDGMVLTVPVCSLVHGHDNTCLLGKGDHPSVHRPSFIAYYQLNLFRAEVLETQEQKGIIFARGLLDEKLFALVCAGVEDSRQAPPKFKKYFADVTAR